MWGSTESREEYFDSINHRLLGQSWIQFEKFLGASIVDIIVNNDPTSYIRKIKETSQSLSNNNPTIPTFLCSNKSGSAS